MNSSVVTIRLPGGEEYEFRVDRSTFTIGRSAVCDLALPSPSVSSTHAEIQTDVAGGGIVVTDLGSKNGTFVVGARIAPHRAVSAGPRDEVKIANVVLRATRYQEQDHSDSLSLDASTSLSRVLLRGMLGDAIRHNRVYFQVLKGPAVGSRLVVDESTERALIGTGPDVGLDLEEPALAGSPIHVVLRGQAYHVVPIDVAPIRVNRERLKATCQLRSGDRVRVLESTILFSDPLQEAVDELARLDAADRSAASISTADRKRAPKALEIAVFGFALLTLLGSALFLLYVVGVFGGQ